MKFAMESKSMRGSMRGLRGGHEANSSTGMVDLKLDEPAMIANVTSAQLVAK